MLKANKTRYQKSKEAATTYKDEVNAKPEPDYKSIKEEFNTKFTDITTTAEAQTETSAKYKAGYKALDSLVATTKEKVAKREKELNYINSLQEFIRAQENYLNQIKSPSNNEEEQNAKLQELLATAREKYDKYVDAAKAYGQKPVEWTIENTN
ncbi:hypothetical protein N8G13_00430 [Mycoplasma zalophi]|uniref:hypothetical protein n=1 Tax=Mycoplasma zalophi TaxID=191287 RepID=UPI0021C79CC9|nr:hypothetical protein [Mycoplasma zalophi]MCU4116932.1 hypothetical protein [Mycoplasma zalophi]